MIDWHWEEKELERAWKLLNHIEQQNFDINPLAGSKKRLREVHK